MGFRNRAIDAGRTIEDDGKRQQYMADVYAAMYRVLMERQSAKESAALDRQKAALDAMVRRVEEAGRIRTDLEDITRKDSNDQLKTLLEAKTALQSNLVDLAKVDAVPNGRIVARLQASLASGSPASAVGEVLGEYFDKDPEANLLINDKALVPTMEMIREELGLSPTDSLTQWAAASQAIPQPVIKRIQQLESSEQHQRAVRDTNRQRISELEARLDESISALQQGNALDDADLVDLGQHWHQSVGELDDEIRKMAAGGADGEIADAQAEFEAQIEQLGKMLQGKDAVTEREVAARIVTNPEFREWAAQYGFSLGSGTFDEQGRFVGYAPGKDDRRAMVTWRWQQKHPKPLRWPGTGQYVEVTESRYVDPSVVDYLTEDGTVWRQGNRYLSPEEYESLGTGAAQYAITDSGEFLRQGDQVWMMQPDGSWAETSEVPDAEWYKVMSPEGNAIWTAEQAMGAPDFQLAEDDDDFYSALGVVSETPEQSEIKRYGELVARRAGQPKGTVGVLTDEGVVFYDPDNLDAHVTINRAQPGKGPAGAVQGASWKQQGKRAAKKARKEAEVEQPPAAEPGPPAVSPPATERPPVTLPGEPGAASRLGQMVESAPTGAPSLQEAIGRRRVQLKGTPGAARGAIDTLKSTPTGAPTLLDAAGPPTDAPPTFPQDARSALQPRLGDALKKRKPEPMSGTIPGSMTVPSLEESVENDSPQQSNLFAALRRKRQAAGSSGASYEEF